VTIFENCNNREFGEKHPYLIEEAVHV